MSTENTITQITEAAQIKTFDDFERADLKTQLDFKNNHSSSYRALFSDTDKSPSKVIDWRDHRKELNFYPSDIKSPDDFEGLTDAGKIYLKEEFPEEYQKIWE